MSSTLKLVAFCLLAALGVAAARADFRVEEPDWPIVVDFPAAPKSDEFRKPTEFGPEVTNRLYLEHGGQRFMLARFNYPVVPDSRLAPALYENSVDEMMRSRPGEILENRPFRLGAYTGKRVVIAQRRDKSVREVRLVQIGGSLYVASAEWPAQGRTVAPESERFFSSISLRASYADERSVEERERWRVLGAGRFHLRYDATRWYRDPTDNEPGVFNLLRVDKLAEAQLICEATPVQTASMEEEVLATARENAESVTLSKRGKKTRGRVVVEELEFKVRAEGITYMNHGYFYSGPGGAVHLRAWSPEKTYAQMGGDIGELLDGLTIGEVPAEAGGRR